MAGRGEFFGMAGVKGYEKLGGSLVHRSALRAFWPVKGWTRLLPSSQGIGPQHPKSQHPPRQS